MSQKIKTESGEEIEVFTAEEVTAKTEEVLLEIDKKLFEKDPKKLIAQKEKQMEGSVKILDFETAAILRDEIGVLKASLEKKK